MNKDQQQQIEKLKLQFKAGEISYDEFQRATGSIGADITNKKRWGKKLSTD